MVCDICGNPLKPGAKYCENCGCYVENNGALNDQQIQSNGGQNNMTQNNMGQNNMPQNQRQSTMFDSLFTYQYEDGNPLLRKSADNMLNDMIDLYFKKNGFTYKDRIEKISKRKNRMFYIYCFINLILISLQFFHISFVFLILLCINLGLLLASLLFYNNRSYIKKEIKSRPDEKISYVIASIMATKMDVSAKKRLRRVIVNLTIFIISVLIPCIVFFKPHLFYEQNGDEYFVRFYTMGLTNPETIIVPETYQNGNVVGIRGNVFANITTVKEVILPDTMTTIRGNAFKGDSNLECISLPDGLQYIGGGCFQDCSSLKSITIPNSVSEMQGETFVNCISLQNVELSSGLTEIRGNTFENCTSLLYVDIPEGVKRIGGHAFYGCSSLYDVKFPDSIQEIGSSAFRLCTSLVEVTIPENTYVNERAFKESPTNVIRR